MLPLLMQHSHQGGVSIQGGKEARHRGRSNSGVTPRSSTGDSEMRCDLGGSERHPYPQVKNSTMCTSSVRQGAEQEEHS